MRRLTTFCLMTILVACIGLLPCIPAATAANILPNNNPQEPYNKVITWIDYTWNGAGKLIDKVMYGLTTGYTNLDGENYGYKISSKVVFKVINGEAYEEESHSVETRKLEDGDGKETKITTDIYYKRDERGRLLPGTYGTRTTNGWTEEVDETNIEIKQDEQGKWYYETDLNGDGVKERHDLMRNDNGTDDPSDDTFKENDKKVTVRYDAETGKFYAADGVITPGEGRKYYEETASLEFANINGQAEIVREITTLSKTYTEKGGDLLSVTEGKVTTRIYGIFNGVTKLVDVKSTGKTTFYGQGTTPDGQLPYTHFTTHTHYAYDNAGNMLAMSGVKREKFGTDDYGNPIYKLYNATTGAEIVDDPAGGGNGNGSSVDEALDLMKGSYTVTYSSGTRKGAQDQWVVFTQAELTPFKVENGMAVSLWTYQEYSNHDLTPNAPANVGDDPIVQGRVVSIQKVQSTANNVGQKNTAAWVIIRDGQGRLWAFRYFGGLSNIGNISVGDRVQAQGDTMAGKASIVEATHQLIKL